MKNIAKALIGGVLVQVGIFLLLLLGVLINVDKLMPNVAKAFVVALLLTAPGILCLVPEGEPHTHHALRLATGIIIDTILYSVIIYVILRIRRKR